MPSLDLDQSLLAAGADFSAADWAHGSASASLDLRAGVALNRGIDLELGIGVMGLLEAGFHKFLAADAQLRLEAQAGLKGQVQLPLDIFGEAGIAVRLEAAARAAAMVRLGVGLNIGDFIALAQQDSRIDGIALELLIILLEEVNAKAGVSAKAAFSAMAYANLALTVRMVEDSARGLKAGFTIGGGFGVGMKAGCGIAVFAELELREPRRFIRRTIDAITDEIYRGIEPQLTDPFARRAAGFVRYPARMALRASFEIGMALAEASPTFSNQGGEIAKQCVHVILEEAQRALLEELAKLALTTFRRALSDVGITPAVWHAAEAQRAAFAGVLQQLPAEPFEATNANTAYWAGLITTGTDLGLALANDAVSRSKWLEPISVLWASAHLAMLSVERISSASARASALGAVSATTPADAFAGSLPPGVAPPAAIRTFINASLGTPAGAALTQDALVEFLVRDTVLETLVHEVPEIQDVLDVVAGPTGESLVAAARTIFRNLGAFAPDPATGQADAHATLALLSQGLRSYIDVRLRQELAPLLHEATGEHPALRIYIDEVLIASMEFAVGTAFQKILEWGAGGIGYRDALREACSSIVMKLFGRSLVVTSDVLTTYALEQASTEVRRFADHVDDDGGAAPALAAMLAADRTLVADVLEETLHICADVLTPMPPERRALIRELLYDLIDTTPADPNADWLDQLRQSFFVPDETNRQRLMQLSEALGSQTVDYMGRFFTLVLLRIGEAVAEQMAATIEELDALVAQWTDAMRELAGEIAARLLALPQQIDDLVDQANASLAEAMRAVEHMLELLRADSVAAALRDALAAHAVTSGVGLLHTVPGYAQLSASQRAIVRDGLGTAARAAVEPIVELVRTAIAFPGAAAEALLSDAAELLDELRAVEPGADAGAEIAAILRRRVETRVQAALAGLVGIDLDFRVSWEVPQPAVWGIVEWEYLSHWPWTVPKAFGWIESPPLRVDFQVALGRVALPPQEVLNIVLATLAQLTALQSRADRVAVELARFFDVEDGARALEAELALAQAQQSLVQAALEDAQSRDLSIEVLAPYPASAQTQDVDIDILLSGVPRSYLGLGELETARAFVWLNQTSLSLDRFAVEEIAPPWSAPEQTNSNGRTPGDHRDAASRAGGGGDTVERYHVRSGAARRAARARTIRATGGAELREEEATAALIATDAATAAWQSPLLDRARGVTKPGRAIHPRLYDPDRTLSARERKGRRADAGHGLRLSTRIASGDCVEGVNTLSIAVINGGGERVERTLVFVMAEGEVREPTVRDPIVSGRRQPVKLPVRASIDPDDLPLGLRRVAQELRADPRIPLTAEDPTGRPRGRSGEPRKRDMPFGIRTSAAGKAEFRKSGERHAAVVRLELERLKGERQRYVERRGVAGGREGVPGGRLPIDPMRGPASGISGEYAP